MVDILTQMSRRGPPHPPHRRCPGGCGGGRAGRTQIRICVRPGGGETPTKKETGGAQTNPDLCTPRLRGAHKSGFVYAPAAVTDGRGAHKSGYAPAAGRTQIRICVRPGCGAHPNPYVCTPRRALTAPPFFSPFAPFFLPPLTSPPSLRPSLPLVPLPASPPRPPQN